MTDIDWTLHNFDEILEYVAEMVGGDFITVVNYANDIIASPENYTGGHAAAVAKILAAHRVKITAVAQYMKLKSPQTKKPMDRLVLSSLQSMYDSLLELINCLKLTTRSEL